ncbi:MAG: hypothetical protein AAF708_19990, partial [Deinococcota bacterium]
VLLTFVLNFGGVGLWLGLVVGLVLASMLLVTRFRYKTHHMMATLPAEGDPLAVEQAALQPTAHHGA